MTNNSRRSFLKIAAATALSLALPALLTSCSENHESHGKDGTIYTCSMHPQIRSNKPGRCPICGMTLTPLVQKNEDHSPHEGGSQNPDEVKLMSAQDSVASIVTQPAAVLALAHTSLVYGDVQPIRDTNVDYTWVYSGRVEKILISYNATEVAKGQPLLEIYSEDAIADQQMYLQSVRERYLTTFYERKIATAQIETYRAKLLRAGMTDQELEALLTNKQIKTRFVVSAPADGSIVSALPQVGERITIDRVLFRIASLDTVWFVGKIFEQDISTLSASREIEIEAKARPGTKYRGKLVFVDRVIDPATRTVQARFEVQNPRRELLPEMSATGYLKTKSAPSLVVPASAVIDTGKRKILYVRTAPQTYQLREVNTGTEGKIDGKEDAFVEIKNGVKEGENVVTSGAFLVDAEAQLRGSSSSHQHGEK